MGLVKYGAGIVQISGSIAGNVHSRNRFGSYIRPRTKPVNPHSSRQESIRAIVSFLSEYWHQELTPAERAAWEIYAAVIPMKNRLGESIFLTGFNHFIRSNSGQLVMGEAVIDAAPSIQSLPEKDPDLICTEEDVAGQTFTFTCNDTGWVPNADPKFGIMISQGHPQLASRNFFKSPFRYMDFIDATEGALGTATLAASFPFAVGQKVWFAARVMTVGGRFSQSWQFDPRVIEADV